MGLERSSKGLAINRAHKFISREPAPSRNFSLHQKTRKINIKSGVVYKYKCPHINHTEQYIGESGRTFRDRYKENLKAPSPIHLHTTTTTGHPVSPDWFSIVSRESQGLSRTIKEAMYIRVNGPSLKTNLCKFQLPHVWDQVLQDTPTPNLK